MNTFLYGALGILIFLVVLTISVALHEAGHMFTAKALKIPVPKYFVGFGPTIWSRKRGGTEYGVKALPLGGFITVEDTTQPEKSPERGLLSHVAPWRRTLIFLAGPAVNLVLGTLIIFGAIWSTPMVQPGTTVDTVNSCSTSPTNCAAEKAGMKPGDKLVSVNGASLSSFKEIRGKFSTEGNTIVVERGGKLMNLSMKANKDKFVGIIMKEEKVGRSAGEAATFTKDLYVMNMEALAQLPQQVPGLVSSITGQEKRSKDSVGSIITVGKTYSETTRTPTLAGDDKVRAIFMYTGLLNLGLGLINLLPLLPLDGGRILFAFIDSIKMRVDRLRKKTYRPTDYRWIEAVTIATGSLVGIFMVLVIVADIVAPIPGL